MTRIIALALVVAAAFGGAPPALAADVRVHYLLDERSIRTVEATAEVAIGLFTDAACATTLSTTSLALADVDLLARVTPTSLGATPKAPKAAELRHTLRGVPAAAPLYARVDGAGVVPIGGACQVQSVAVPTTDTPVLVDANGTVLGPYGVAADRGYPVWLRAAGDVSYAVVVEATEIRGLDYQLSYEAADCSSPPLIYADFYPVLLFFPSVSRGTTLYHPVGPPTQRVARAWSYEAEMPASCGGGAFVPPHHCCLPLPPNQIFANDYLETATTDIGQYQAPFRVELR